jgi:hypothetical protein
MQPPPQLIATVTLPIKKETLPEVEVSGPIIDIYDQLKQVYGTPK